MNKNRRTYAGRQWIITIITAMLLIGALLFGILRYTNDRENVYYNNARILVADDLQTLPELFVRHDFTDYVGNYPVVLLSLNGEVLYSSQEEYTIGESVVLNRVFQPDQSTYQEKEKNIRVSFVVESENGTEGFALFYVPRDEAVGGNYTLVIWSVFMPVIAASGIVILMSIGNAIYARKKISNPVSDILRSTDAMIEGNYGVPLKKEKLVENPKTDLDKLELNFERMRDELENSQHREEELKRSQKEIMSCISHDLKTPISTIRAYSEGLRDGLADDAGKTRHYAEVIIDKTEVLTKMIRDLLEQNNAELNQLSFHMKEQYLTSFMDKAAEELGKVAAYHQFSFLYENNAPDLLLAFDENRMMQVLANLVDNAVKYANSDIGHPQIAIKVSFDGHSILIAVEDNGPGIEMTDIPFVFNKFYRGEKSRSTAIPGSGLGLSICKYIVEQHNGELTLTSRKNIGTSFLIRLPIDGCTL